MTHILDLLYLLVLVLLSPWLFYKACTTGKYRRGLLAKLLGLTPSRNNDRRCVWFHGVSVGEVHLLRQVVAAFRRRHPGFEVVISTTTDTGLEEAGKHFSDLTVFHWPFDFSWSVKRAMKRIRPELVVLTESEIWPNFLRIANDWNVKTAVINGRMSPRSSRRYGQFAFLLRPFLKSINLWSLQTEEYAQAIRKLLCSKNQPMIEVTGNVKYDGVQSDRGNEKTIELGRLFDLAGDDLIWVAGSTQAPEEEKVLSIYRRLKIRFPKLRLIIVPRQRERFDEVAHIIEKSQTPFVRRSHLSETLRHSEAVILVDTIGELGAVWGLADIAFVGGSFDGKRGGQNMIEPAAYGSAVLFGPHVWNFTDTVNRLLQNQAAIQVSNAVELEKALLGLLQNAVRRSAFGTRARQFVKTQQGATEKTITLLVNLLESEHKRHSYAA